MELSEQLREITRQCNGIEALVVDGRAKTEAAIGTLRARMDEMDQKLVRRALGAGYTASPSSIGSLSGSSLGSLVASSPELQAIAAGGAASWRGRVRIKAPSDLAALTTLSTATRDVLVPPDRMPAPIAPAQRRMTVRGLLTPGRTSSNAVQFVKETAFTNNAAPVSEGATKPETTFEFELDSEDVATIAHWTRASKQILDDSPMLSSYIDNRLRYGLAYAEEVQLLSGDGTLPNLHGLIPQATAYSAAFTPSSPTMLDTLGLALTQAEQAELPATGIVLNVVDWRRLTMLKNSQGDYLGSGPFSVDMPQLWGIPVVPTNAMSQDKFLVGAFGLAAQLFDREDATVEVSTEDQDNFVRNLVSIRCEARETLIVTRPAALIFGDFGNVSG
jgi:HK97 family phage major capsid protein